MNLIYGLIGVCVFVVKREYSANASEISTYKNLQEFVDSSIVPGGYISIGTATHPLYVRNDNVGAETTIVFLHGAIDQDAVLPVFVGQGISSGLNVNRIFISDPSLELDSTLNISWYAGSATWPTLQQDLGRVIDHILQSNGARYLVFFGSSAGGFASLMLSRRFPGSLALTMNPQTRIGDFYPKPVSNYLDLAWGLSGSSTLNLPHGVTHDLVGAYSGGFENTIGYIQNARDWFHILNHQVPLIDVIGQSPNTLMLMDRWGPPGGDGHVPASKDVLRPIFESVVACRGNWSIGLLGAGFQSDTTQSAVKRRVIDSKPAA